MKSNMKLVLACLALEVLNCYSVEVPYSPCPRIFNYFHNVVWMGRLTVPMPSSGLPVITQVFLSLRASLQSRYVGLIELNEPVEIAVDNIMNSGTRIINYTVLFPLPSPLPTLTLIKVNNVTVCCSGEQRYGLFTNILLEHTFPTNPYYFSDNMITTTDKNEISYEMCGRKRPTKSLEPLTLTGYGEWPWLAAVLVEHSTGLEFYCTGNLLTEKHILTAAHCVRTRTHKLYGFKKYVVYLGKYDLNKWNEPNSQVRYVEDIIVHPDYRSKLYTSDIALLVLDEPVVLNFFVRPVCLWERDPELTPYVGRIGTVVGWGKDGTIKKLNSQPKMFYLPIVDQEECLRSRRDYFYITSGKTFCAGLRNGVGPCNGDSGSGLMMPQTDSHNQTIWYLRGIISLSLLDPYKQTCDLSNYLVFTDIAKFTDWIDETIQSTY